MFVSIYFLSISFQYVHKFGDSRKCNSLQRVEAHDILRHCRRYLWLSRCHHRHRTPQCFQGHGSIARRLELTASTKTKTCESLKWPKSSFDELQLCGRRAADAKLKLWHFQ